MGKKHGLRIMNWRTVPSLCIAVTAGFLGSAAGVFAELPSESTLPGQPPVAAALPAAALPAAALPAAALPAAALPAAALPAAALPNESTLPRGFAVAPVAIERIQLPAEEVTTLPAPSHPADTAPAATPAADTAPVENPTADTPPVENPGADTPPVTSVPTVRTSLPSESILPPASQIPAPPQDGDEDPDPTEADVLNLSRSADVVPWLRLDMKGHVGPVRALAFLGDSGRLCSGGEDKSILVWGRPRPQGPWQCARSIYWQVQRGSRGRIYALATRGNLIAFGGHGAMGGLGEILLVDALTGNLQAALYDEQIGHRQVIVSLAFSPDPRRPGLASIDRAGKALYWQPDSATGLWKPREIQGTDTAHYGESIAARLRAVRGFAPLVMVDDQHVVLPVYAANPRLPDAIVWQLEKINVRTGVKQPWPGQRDIFHFEMVTALAASEDGTRLASADAAGHLSLWDRKGRLATKRLEGACITLAFNHDGRTLVSGTAKNPKGQPALIQSWNLAEPGTWQKWRADIACPHDVYACALSRDGKYLAYTRGNDVVVRPFRDAGESRLRAAVRSPLRVAFAKDQPYYRIAIGTQSRSGRVPLEQTFDTSQLQLGTGRVVESKWISSDWRQLGWKVQTRRDSQTGEETYQLTHNGDPRARIPLDPSLHGTPSAWCWIPTRKGEPFAVAIGTSGNNNIYVFRLTERGTSPLLRVFRGHAGRVTSVGVSLDLRYLVSGSQDSTIRVWPLSELHADQELVNRWGARIEIRGDELQIVSIREDGPLYFRGMRQGDVIRRLRWVQSDAQNALQPKETSAAAEMLRTLRDQSWDTLVAFDYTRGRMPGRTFQMFPAWQQLVSLVVAENRQWAYWSPTGYYDASFEGHKLFGWQVNRGLEVLPDFFLAAQVRASLERPEAMSRLLDAGSIDAVFRLGQGEVPADLQRPLADAYQLKPQVEILAPTAGDAAAGQTVHVRAAVSVREGQQLVPPKVFANGVVGSNRRFVRSETIAGGRKYIYEWDAALPSQRQILLQVVAATDAEVAATDSVTITRSSLPPRRAARLFVATAGINQYLDSQLPRLDYAVNNANQVATLLNQQAYPLYTPQAVSLSNLNVTRSAWNAALHAYGEEVRTRVTPDDLLLIFLSGHGVRDPVADKYYYLTSNVRFTDVTGRRYGDCLSLEDFEVFADLPCRKLVILDTCHSGALQPLRQRELKSALRALQQDVVFTLTASEGGQEAVEERDRNLGRFTSRLLEGLRGTADQQDGNSDGIVSWSEVVRYVERMVTADSIGDEYQQYPTSGPAELLHVADFPLTVARPESRVGHVGIPQDALTGPDTAGIGRTSTPRRSTPAVFGAGAHERLTNFNTDG
ncbi:MAG: caspase family protein [Pirellulaceae bacterium]